ncbi:MAG TPA: DUF2157 domain-containing protein [Gammaproteobacteria bacterium]
MSNATPRRAALDEIVRLARAHGLTAEEIAAALVGSPGSQAGAARGSSRSSALARLFAYLGGTFVFAGVAIFIAIRWGELNSAARVVATLGSGLAAFAMAYAATRDARFEKAATPLFVTAAVLEPYGILVALDEYASGGDWRYAVLAACLAVGAQQLAAFAALRRTELLFLGVLLGAGFTATGMDLLGIPRDLIALVVGASLASFGVAAERAGRGAVAPYWYFFGAASCLAGFFGLVEDTPVEPVFLGAAAGCIYAQHAAPEPRAAGGGRGRHARVHRLLHGRAVRGRRRLAARPDRVRARADRVVRLGGAARSPLHRPRARRIDPRPAAGRRGGARFPSGASSAAGCWSA